MFEGCLCVVSSSLSLVATEVDNKETFTKEHVWEVFKSFMVDMATVIKSV